MKYSIFFLLKPNIFTFRILKLLTQKLILMKNFTLIIALLVMAWGANAQVLNNPKDANGNMIFKWNCGTNQFATSNDFEVDENVVFAVDLTGTPLEAWLLGAASGITRSIAFDFWTQWGGNLDGRFVRIKPNIYGATLNFKQFATSRQKQLIMLEGTPLGGTYGKATDLGTSTELYANIFGFGYTLADSNWGKEWWQLAMVVAVSTKTAPYTGTKTSADFYKNDVSEADFFPGGFNDWMGYAAPCLVVTDVASPSVSNSPVIGYEYYNIQGMNLKRQPESGLFIQKTKREDGSISTQKIFK